MTFEIDQILIIPIIIICVYKFITEKKNDKNTKKVTSYERIGLISEYEDQEMLQDIKDEIICEEPDIDVTNGRLFGKQGGKIAFLFKQYLEEINE